MTGIKIVMVIVAIAFYIVEPLHSENVNCSQICLNCDDEFIECADLRKVNFDFLRNQIFTSTKSIVYTGNSISTLNETIMPYFELSNLERLDLSNNKIQKIQSMRVFSNMPNLKELILDDNLIDFGNNETFDFFKPLSKSLVKLSLNNAFKPDFSSIKISNLIKSSQLENLVELNLADNFLKDPDFKDIFCKLPHLKLVHLANNQIEKIDFNMNCLTNLSGLELLNFESNKIQVITKKSITKFVQLKTGHSRFRLNLLNNPFRCDCSLKSFYKWLLTNESTEIIVDKYNLKCLHPDSISFALNKTVLASNLEEYCPNDQEEYSASLGKSTLASITYYPVRYRTYRPRRPNQRQNEMKFSISRITLITITCVFIVATIVLLMTSNCKKIWRKFKQNRYSQFRDYNFDENTIDGSSNADLFRGQAAPRIQFRNDDEENEQLDGGFINYQNERSTPINASFLTRFGSFLSKFKRTPNNDDSDMAPFNDMASFTIQSEPNELGEYSSKTKMIVYPLP